MSEVRMTVTKALAERKKLSNKITKLVTNFESVKAVKNSKIRNIGDITIPQWEGEIKSMFQKINTLTLNYDALNSAIIKYNAETKVNAFGRDMTIAELIAMKSSPMTKTIVDLYKRMELNLNSQKATMETMEEEALSYTNIQNAIAVMKALDSTVKSEAKLESEYIASAKPVLIDPLKKERETGLEKYESYQDIIDSLLQETNSKTVIVINYYD